MIDALRRRLTRPADLLPLAIFRIGFGVLMLFSALRFTTLGWIDAFYIAPGYHFSYFGFDWVRPLPPAGMYAAFAILSGCAVLIALGLFYRAAIVTFFVLFTYVELIDLAYYLNHYYFISVMSLLMTVLPLNRTLSLDARWRPELRASTAPAWMVAAPRIMLGLVYVYAGIAKLNPDWLIDAQPLRIWLRASAGMPVIGPLFDQPWIAHAMSWAGAAFDLTIPFWLSWRRSRPLAYLVVIGFHTMTGLLFPIGVFPWVMIACTLVFFGADDWRWLFARIGRTLPTADPTRAVRPARWIAPAVALFFAWQVLMPLRHWLYPGNYLWTNEGFRFAWHVMLVEKNGAVTFRVEDPATDRFWIVYPSDYLTRVQEHQMSFQPDMIAQFARFLADKYAPICGCEPAVYADTHVSMNGRPGQPIVDSGRDLSRVRRSLLSADWIVPLATD
ncbi:MAG: HTTM domain-containing protein [Chloroflexi bacterium]|nr:HTTM domain-containing protein [Chloroflexota bacterium]